MSTETYPGQYREISFLANADSRRHWRSWPRQAITAFVVSQHKAQRRQAVRAACGHSPFIQVIPVPCPIRHRSHHRPAALTEARDNFCLSRVSANGYHGSGLAAETPGGVTFIGERRRTQERTERAKTLGKPPMTRARARVIGERYSTAGRWVVT